MKISEIKNQAYLLPWNNANSAQCFLEVTRKCSLNCPKCYQQNGFKTDQHKPLELIKEEIDIIIKAINPPIIGIVGGEPLEFPQLTEVVEYIKDKKIAPAIISNVVNLDKQTLKNLIDHGLQIVYAHIDRQTGFHTYGNNSNETLMAKKRDEFANLLRKYKGKIEGALGMMIDRDNINDIPDVIRWTYQNSDVIKNSVLIFTDDDEARDLIQLIQRKIPNFVINSYLKSTDEENVSWARSTCQIKKNGKQKYLKPVTLKFLYGFLRLLTRKNLSIMPLHISKLFPKIFTTTILTPRSYGSDNFCAGCPDQTVVWEEKNNKRVPLIVHSCINSDFYNEELSRDELVATRLAKENPQRSLSFSCGFRGEYYDKDSKVIKDWNRVLDYPKDERF